MNLIECLFFCFADMNLCFFPNIASNASLHGSSSAAINALATVLKLSKENHIFLFEN